jgi:hypothetical protein
VLRKLLTGKAIAGIAVASLITAGTAAAATGQFHGKDRGVVSPNAMSDSFVRPTTRANAESDPSTTSATTSTSTSTSTTSTTVVSSPTVVAPPATHGGGIGPDVNGPAKHGLCTAYLASLDPKNVSAPPFRNLVQAAVDAGQTVQEFCADVMGTTSTSSDNADQGNNGHGDRSGHSGKAGNDHSGD